MNAFLALDWYDEYRRAPVVKWISQWPSKPLLGVRVPSGVPKLTFNSFIEPILVENQPVSNLGSI